MNIPKEIEYILQKLALAGKSAYLVGGCVRDFLLGTAPSDFDITTSALPEETLEIFKDDRVIPTGIVHGTVTVIVNGVSAEVTTYRTESEYTDGRHPDKVEFSTDISRDLCRRDFTVNAMAMGLDGEIVDLYGGMEDLKRKTIRAVGEPRERFLEDALRILRAFRFAAKLGFDIEKDTLNAALSLADRLSLVSRERIFAELEKLLVGEEVGEILAIMHEGGVLQSIFEEPKINTDAFSYIDTLPKSSAIRMAALLLHDENVKKHIVSLKTSQSFVNEVMGIIECEAPADYSAESLRRMIYKHGKNAASFALVTSDSLLYEKLAAILNTESCFSVGDLELSGSDVMKYTRLQGREVGEMLEKLLFLVFDKKLENQRETLISYLSNYSVDN